MAIFGQVWFACLVGFGAGVLLTWLLWVRPVQRRAGELERSLDERPSRSSAPYDGDPDSAADFEPVRADSDDGFLRDLRGDDNRERDDFPRVDSYFKPEPQDDRRYADPASFAERTRFAPQPPPEPVQSSLDGSSFENFENKGHVFEPADFEHTEPEPTRFADPVGQEPTRFAEPEQPTRFADPVGQEPTRFAEPMGQEPTRFAEPAGQPTQFAQPVGQEPTQFADPVEPTRFTNGHNGQLARDGGNDADQRYLEFLRSGNGQPPEDNATERGALSLGHHGQDDVDPAEMTTILPPNAAETGPIEADPSVYPPASSGDDLPHRLGGETYADRVPFVDNQSGDGDARSGQLTPIGERGFLPFEKPLNPDEFTNKDLWVGENGQLIVSDENQPPAGRHDQEATRFNQAPEPTRFNQPGFTQQLPMGVEDNAAPRSLFEPVIDADQPPHRPGDQQFPPRPIRVRTGVNGNGRPPGPARAPAGSNGWQVGPFGPGSALPLPDGSAPSPQFRVKARTSSMVFHTEASPFYDRLEPQVWFRSVEDAQRAGFTSWERSR